MEKKTNKLYLKRVYESPMIMVMEHYSEGVLCQSTTEDVEFEDGEW